MGFPLALVVSQSPPPPQPLPQLLLLLSPIESILTKDATGIIATWRIWHVNIEILILSPLTSHRIAHDHEWRKKSNVYIKYVWISVLLDRFYYMRTIIFLSCCCCCCCFCGCHNLSRSLKLKWVQLFLWCMHIKKTHIHKHRLLGQNHPFWGRWCITTMKRWLSKLKVVAKCLVA